MLLIGLLIAVIAFGGSDEAQRPSSATAHPTLTVMGMNPLAVRGLGFRPSERVVVTTASARTSVTASATGRFVARFTRIRCAGSPIRAVGSKGSRAVTRPPKIVCVEP